MLDQSEPRTLAEAEVIARHAGKLNWWAEKIMQEYDRREIERVAELLQRVAEAQAAEARIELLTAALGTAVEALGWASDYVGVPWPKAYEPLRTTMAAAPTEAFEVALAREEQR